MKHLIYAVVAASAVGLSTGAFACEEAYTASADQSILVAQQQAPSAPATKSSVDQNKGAGVTKSK
jgi:hypothetical protein